MDAHTYHHGCSCLCQHDCLYLLLEGAPNRIHEFLFLELESEIELVWVLCLLLGIRRPSLRLQEEQK